LANTKKKPTPKKKSVSKIKIPIIALAKRKKAPCSTGFDYAAHAKNTLAPWQFKPGNTNGAAGRPTNILTARFKLYLNQPSSSLPAAAEICKNLKLDPEKTLIADALAIHTMDRSFSMLSSQWLQQLMERIEGKVAQTQILETSPVSITDVLQSIVKNTKPFTPIKGDA
jgi:hypothetical protein